MYLGFHRLDYGCVPLPLHKLSTQILRGGLVGLPVSKLIRVPKSSPASKSHTYEMVIQPFNFL